MGFPGILQTCNPLSTKLSLYHFQSLVQGIAHNGFLHRSFATMKTIGMPNSGELKTLDRAVTYDMHLKQLHTILGIFMRHSAGETLPLKSFKPYADLDLKCPLVQFLRLYPTVFHEIKAPRRQGRRLQPQFKLTDAVMDIYNEEHNIHRELKTEHATKLSRIFLLMGERRPLSLFRALNHLKWDLGLPENFRETIVPEFADRFRIVYPHGYHQPALELLDDSLGQGMSTVLPCFTRLDRYHELDIPKLETLAVALCELLGLMVRHKASVDALAVLFKVLPLPRRFYNCFKEYPQVFYLTNKFGDYYVTPRKVFQRPDMGFHGRDHPIVYIREKYVRLMNEGVLQAEQQGLESYLSRQ